MAALEAYSASDWRIVGAAVALCLLNIVCGYALQRNQVVRYSLVSAWLLGLGTPLVMDQMAGAEAAGFRMLAIVFVLFYGMKGVVGVAAARKTGLHLPLRRWMMFAVLWPGMRPALFLKPLRWSSHGRRFALWGVIHTATGVAFVLAARWIWRSGDQRLYLGVGAPAWVMMMVGASLILQFGFFNLLAALWQARGIDTTPVFRAPLKSRSLAEFWSRRWNLAFSEMTALVIYQPLEGRIGRAGATMAGFVFSGLLHELAASLPVRGGFGLPTLYFVIQGIAVLVTEKLGIKGLPARVITIAVIALPFPILFHAWFLEGAVVPLLGGRQE